MKFEFNKISSLIYCTLGEKNKAKYWFYCKIKNVLSHVLILEIFNPSNYILINICVLKNLTCALAIIILYIKDL